VSLNETRLKTMGVKPSVSRAFRLNRQYNLTRQVRLVAALDTLEGVPGRPAFVARAAGAQVDADAQFYTESALLAEMFHRTQKPLTEIVADLPGACVLAEDDRFACLFPLDYIAWTEGVAGHFDRITKRIEVDFPKAKRELWLTGRVSSRTADELQTGGAAGAHARSGEDLRLEVAHPIPFESFSVDHVGRALHRRGPTRRSDLRSIGTITEELR
jgi:hypothetical protein